jgi:hypothetical protein
MTKVNANYSKLRNLFCSKVVTTRICLKIIDNVPLDKSISSV